MSDLGKDPKELALEIAANLRARMRELSIRDEYGEEVVVLGPGSPLDPRNPPPHKRAFMMEFSTMKEARAWYDQTRTTVRTIFAQLVRQDNTHPMPYAVRWGVGKPDVPLLHRPEKVRFDRAAIRFGVCLGCKQLWRNPFDHKNCVVQKKFDTARITHMRTWGDDWGFKHGESLPSLAFETFEAARAYCTENVKFFGWLRLGRMMDGDESYYVVERRLVKRSKPKPRTKRDMTHRCEVCNLSLEECPGMIGHKE